ncbi:MAG: hypothetical protein II942_00350, partial [Alphaproteobacteria bacterium]|nr:hypothetical protein [Alphaproteobacteria bacterium]
MRKGNKTKRGKATKQNERGRSILETLGVLAILVLLTWLGIQVFSYVYTNVVTNALEKEVMTHASVRLHEVQKSWDRGADVLEVKGPYDFPIRVENGTEGTLKDVFWVSLNIVNSSIRQAICNRLLGGVEQLQKSNSNLAYVTVDDKVLEECLAEPETVTYYFGKPGVSVPGGIIIHTDDCPNPRICPSGAICEGNIISCLAGFVRSGDPCDTRCTKDGRCASNIDCFGGRHCSPITRTCVCPYPRISWSEEKRQCVCPGNTTWDENTKKCICTKEEDCLGNMVCEAEECTCKSNMVWSEEQQQCICPDGLQWDEDAGECLCTKNADCPGDMVCNLDTKKCDCCCGKVWDEQKKECVCPNGEKWDGVTCVKKCSKNADCPNGMVCPKSGNCACPVGQFWDEEVQKCVCPEGQLWSSTTGQCVCVRDHCCQPCTEWSEEQSSCVSVDCGDTPIIWVYPWGYVPVCKDGYCPDGTPCQEGGVCSNHCPSGKVWCQRKLKCVECEKNSDCVNKDGKLCDTVANICVNCRYDADCKNGKICRQTDPADVTSKTCVCPGKTEWSETRQCCVCSSNDDCPEGQICNENNICVPDKPCTTTADCDTGEVCDEENGVCVECLEDNDCTDGKVCNSQHMCVCPGKTTWDEIKQCCSCTENSDCLDGQVCNSDHICVCPGKTVWDPSKNCCSCTADEDCLEGQVCNSDHICVCPGKTVWNPSKNCCTCTADDDCPAGQICNEENKCETPIPCNDDSVCPDGMICIEGMCKIPKPCADNNDCPKGQICDKNRNICVGNPCPNDANGNPVVPNANGICCVGVNAWDPLAGSYTVEDLINCGCPEDPNNNNIAGAVGNVPNTCCSLGLRWNNGSYDMLDVASCGCPNDANGGAVNPNANNECCVELKIWDAGTKTYKNEDPAKCGCPEDVNNSNTQGVAGKIKGTCCSLGRKLVNGKYNVVDPDACDCPETYTNIKPDNTFTGGNNDAGSVGKVPNICCSNGLAWNGLDDSIFGGYTDINIAACDCPPGGAPVDDQDPKAQAPKQKFCCNNKGQEWDSLSYKKNNYLNCGCPEDFNNNKGTYENGTCCFDLKSYNSKTDEYDQDDVNCGCPKDSGGTAGVPAPAGKPTTCCLNGKGWDGKDYEEDEQVCCEEHKDKWINNACCAAGNVFINNAGNEDCCDLNQNEIINNECCPKANAFTDNAGVRQCCDLNQNEVINNECCPQANVFTDNNGVKQCCDLNQNEIIDYECCPQANAFTDNDGIRRCCDTNTHTLIGGKCCDNDKVARDHRTSDVDDLVCCDTEDKQIIEVENNTPYCGPTCGQNYTLLPEAYVYGFQGEKEGVTDYCCLNEKLLNKKDCCDNNSHPVQVYEKTTSICCPYHSNYAVQPSSGDDPRCCGAYQEIVDGECCDGDKVLENDGVRSCCADGEEVTNQEDASAKKCCPSSMVYTKEDGKYCCDGEGMSVNADGECVDPNACPADWNGDRGERSEGDVCCKNNLAWNDKDGSYNTFDAANCGCPKTTSGYSSFTHESNENGSACCTSDGMAVSGRDWDPTYSASEICCSSGIYTEDNICCENDTTNIHGSTDSGCCKKEKGGIVASDTDSDEMVCCDEQDIAEDMTNPGQYVCCTSENKEHLTSEYTGTYSGACADRCESHQTRLRQSYNPNGGNNLNGQCCDTDKIAGDSALPVCCGWSYDRTEPVPVVDSDGNETGSKFCCASSGYVVIEGSDKCCDTYDHEVCQGGCVTKCNEEAGYVRDKEDIYCACVCPEGKEEHCDSSGYCYCDESCPSPLEWDASAHNCVCPDGGHLGNDGETCCSNGSEYTEETCSGRDDSTTHYCKPNRTTCGCPEGSSESEHGCCSSAGYYDDGTQGKSGWSFGANNVDECHKCGYGTYVSDGYGEYCCNNYGADISNRLCDGDDCYTTTSNCTAVCCEAMNVNSEKCCRARDGNWISTSESEGVCCGAEMVGYRIDGETQDFEHCGCPYDKNWNKGDWTAVYDTEGACCYDGYLLSTKTGVYDKIDWAKCGCPSGSELPPDSADGAKDGKFYGTDVSHICCISGWSGHAYVSEQGYREEEENVFVCGCLGDECSSSSPSNLIFHASVNNGWQYGNGHGYYRDCCPKPETYDGENACCAIPDDCEGFDFSQRVCCLGSNPNHAWRNSTCCNGVINMSTDEQDPKCCPGKVVSHEGGSICCGNEGQQYSARNGETTSEITAQCCMAMGVTSQECCTAWKSESEYYYYSADEWNYMASKCCSTPSGAMSNTYTSSSYYKFCCDDSEHSVSTADYSQCCPSNGPAYAISGGEKECCNGLHGQGSTTFVEPDCCTGLGGSMSSDYSVCCSSRSGYKIVSGTDAMNAQTERDNACGCPEGSR